MARPGFVMAVGEVTRRLERTACVVLKNGHLVYARCGQRSGVVGAVDVGDRVRVEVTVADPRKGFVVERLGKA